MGLIYQLSLEEEKILIQSLEKMIQEHKVCSLRSLVGSPIQFIPKLSCTRCLQLCVDCCHLNNHTKKDKTPLPIVEEFQYQVKGAIYIT